MKCYKFWVRETKNIRIGNAEQPITLVAGSNISKDDASSNATQIASAIEERIRNPKQWTPRQGLRSEVYDYEVDIKEHIDTEIDPNNIITINRYGAQVLNTTEYTILDLDYIFLRSWIIFVRKETQKDKIIDRFKQRIARHPELGTSFRIYETCKGIRIIGKTYFGPQSKTFPSVMRSLNVDPLYACLSRKQNCYRARLTPKPYRMKMEKIRIATPLECETDAYAAWQKKYAGISQNYSVVNLRETIGNDFGNDPVILLHDHTANMHAHYPLV